jgi:hypothetical protein
VPARDLAPPRPPVPVEFIGLARALPRKITSAHPAVEAAADNLLAPFRPRPGFTPMPRHAALRRLAARWRALPALGRLRCVIANDPGHLQIVELRVTPSRVVAAAWSEDEPALAIKLTTIAIKPPQFEEKHLLIAGVGLHALARRFQRGAPRTDAGVLADLLPVATAYRAIARAKGEFAVPAGGGRWIGAVGPADAVALVRTYVEE